MQELILNFYGGEPLLNKPEIEYIAAHMKGWCEANGIRFKWMIQTNGALLTKELVREYKKLGLYLAKISVDGTREVHDAQRPMRGSGKGTFDTVMGNVRDIVEDIEVYIAAGYDKGDPSGILALLDYLEGVGVLAKLKKFTYSPIHPALGPEGHTEKIVSPGCMANYESETLLSSEKIIKEHLRKKGLHAPSGLSTSMCPVTSGDNNVTIDTQGAIFKCAAMLGHPELAVGSIFEDAYNAQYKQFMDADAWKKCDADCPYAPLCNTGCRLFSFFKTQDFTAKSCERGYMDKFVPESIVREYENQMRKKAASKEALV